MVEQFNSPSIDGALRSPLGTLAETLNFGIQDTPIEGPPLLNGILGAPRYQCGSLTALPALVATTKLHNYGGGGGDGRILGSATQYTWHTVVAQPGWQIFGPHYGVPKAVALIGQWANLVAAITLSFGAAAGCTELPSGSNAGGKFHPTDAASANKGAKTTVKLARFLINTIYRRLSACLAAQIGDAKLANIVPSTIAPPTSRAAAGNVAALATAWCAFTQRALHLSERALVPVSLAIFNGYHRRGFRWCETVQRIVMYGLL